ncbi:helix-turn-helix domain-containing protein [uncultured Exiguobacterium sp.]|uniref:helix-turn-helix domain-containing protein n=1 Tax=uncultured Exiguobacterium sp. TaxID=202669 RepID=UPI0025E9B6BC|nr:helix-turn-helix domain-containing protein [uncultured Exiguobacterium sp.]
MRIESFGKQIKQLRIERKLTQKELAKGVCSQAELSKIETGKVIPTIDLVQRFSQKLRISMDQIFIDSNEINLFERYDVKLSDFSRQRQYDEMLEFMKRLPINLPASVQLLIHYFEWVAREGKKDIDYRTCISQLLRLSDEQQMETEYPVLYLRIRMSVANYYYLNGQYRYARKIYQELLTYDYSTDTLKKLQCKVLYNHAQQLYFQNDFETGLEITEKGIALSVERKITAMLGHFYYQKGCFYEELMSPERDIRDAFTYAYTLFTAFDNENHAALVLKGKKQFLYFQM